MNIPFTKLGATIGPASENVEMIVKLIHAGMSFARLNFSHGDYEADTRLIGNIREASRKCNRYIAILQDLQGPKLRLGTLPEGGIALTKGQEIVLSTSLHEYGDKEIPLPFVGLEKSLHPGERLLVDDGLIELSVTTLEPGIIKGVITVAGTLKSHKGLNFPDSTLVAIPALSQKDKDDVRFGLSAGVDIISLSFVKRAQDVTELKLLIAKLQEELGLPKRPVPVVAKIERPEALQNLEEIIEAADIIMVARGDLGLETPISSLPVEQKTIVAAARRKAKPVMVATQLLYSMEHNPRPTRAEVSDIGNAVVDHADALLLTNETAMGEYPVPAVEMMRDTALAMEKSVFDDAERVEETLKISSVQEVLSKVSETLASETSARLVVAYSKSGELARFLSHHRLGVPVVIGSANPFVRAYSSVIWGLETIVVDEPKDFEEFVRDTLKILVTGKRLKKGDQVVVVSAERLGKEEASLVEVRKI